MKTQIKWIRPTTHNVKALWVRIKNGQFRTANGVPRFHVVKDVEDPDIVYLTWTYDKTALVRCPIDDFPAYLPDEPPQQLQQILTRIAGRDLRPPSVNLTEVGKAIDTVQRYVEEAEEIFTGKLLSLCLDEDTEQNVTEVFRATLDEMVGRRMIKGA